MDSTYSTQTKTDLFNLEAERRVLCSCIKDMTRVPQVRAILQPDYFYEKIHGVVFEILCTMHHAGQPADFIRFNEELQKKGFTRDASFWQTIGTATATSVNVEYHAGIVAGLWRRRERVRIAAEIQQAEKSGETERIPELVRRLEELSKDTNRQSKADSSGLQTILEETISGKRSDIPFIHE